MTLPASAYKTYGFVAPRATHHRRATCDEIGCEALEFGWLTTIDEATDLGREQGAYVRRHSGRAFSEERMPDGLTQFRFGPGQQCFREHWKSLDHDPLYFVRNGTERARPHVRAVDWLEDFSEHQATIHDIRERG